MCQSIYLEDDGREIGTVGELAALVEGKQNIFDTPDVGISVMETEDRFCLCGVDIERTMRHAGYAVRRGEWDTMEFVCSRLTGETP